MKQGIKIIVMLLVMIMSGCATKELKAPCDDYGRYCDPKVAINQWTPNP